MRHTNLNSQGAWWDTPLKDADLAQPSDAIVVTHNGLDDHWGMWLPGINLWLFGNAPPTCTKTGTTTCLPTAMPSG